VVCFSQILLFSDTACYLCKNLFRFQPAGHPEGPAERFPLRSEFDARNRGVHPRASARKCRGRIRNHFATSSDNPQKSGCFCSYATADAGSYCSSIAPPQFLCAPPPLRRGAPEESFLRRGSALKRLFYAKSQNYVQTLNYLARLDGL
jgi:hypothetical protein